MEKSILYIEKLDNTIVHYINKESESFSISILKYLDSLCLKNLTTLEGRLDAIKYNFNIVKNVPIYITENLVLFATHNKRNSQNKYINSIYVKSIEKVDSAIKIEFYDGEFVLVKNSYHIIKNNYEKCLKIKKQINQYS